MKQSTKRHRVLKNDIRFSTLLLIPLILFGLMGWLPSVNANDIQVSNLSLNKDTGGAYWEVSFDITWQNSWRTDNLNGDGATNWDAAWVFVKYYERTNSTWGHAYLTPDGHTTGSGTVAELVPGKVNENGVYDATDNPIVGAMLYRSENGSGTFSASGVTLRWDYTATGLSAGSDVMTDLFAIEMVHVAPGPFFLGSGGSEDHRFYAGGTDNNPFLVTDDWDGCVADAEGCLWATGSMITSSDYLGGQALTPDYPRGTEGFTIMKYEISQQQYVDFLNSLTPAQASVRATTTEGERQGIREVSGKYATSTPYVAANRLSWVDGAAYLDWAGLRPMTELEYEKAARGFSGPVADEYAWGTTHLQSTGGSGNYSNLGDATETVSQGNAVYSGSNPGGPARVGIFAGEGNNREAAGAGYWGVMELSGNLWERTVSGGNADGRAYRGYHGDGMLAEQGVGDVETWPGNGSAGITGSAGSGFRGGNFTSNGGNDLRTSDRNNGNTTNTDRNRDYGFRGVRGMPDDGLYELNVVIVGEGSVTKVPDLEAYELGTQVELTALPSEGLFVSWAGNFDGSDESANLLMNENKTIIAHFSQMDTITEVVEVVNPATGVVWMDRNLGASRPATSSTDGDAYGDLYQWGRAADGHEKRNSSTRNTQSDSNQPGHGDFITTGNTGDWRIPQNDNLWQGVGGVNNPCPVGYRLPSVAEWQAERGSWDSNYSAGAYGSPLKLSLAGYRSSFSGTIFTAGSFAYYWSSSVDGAGAGILYFRSDFVNVFGNNRSNGHSVRCLKDGVSFVTLVIDIEGNGSVDPVGGTFELGSEVELTATPDEGWLFSDWTGDVSADLPDGAAMDSVITLTMDSDKSVTAVFEFEGSLDGWPRDTVTAVVDVVNPVTGVTWMDRNLGASRAAVSRTDSEGYGDLYQWGRPADGHEKRTSETTSTLSTTDQPVHGDFIIGSSDWRSPSNNNLWQGVVGRLNNPCPLGYRLPTDSEWNAERGSWISNNRDGAYASPLKLPVAGRRDRGDGTLIGVGGFGAYWSSSVDGPRGGYLYFSSSLASVYSYTRANGKSVRCLKK